MGKHQEVITDENLRSEFDQRVSNAMPPKPDTIAQVLAERGNQYGDFTYNAATTQAVMDIFMSASNAGALNANHKEAIHMIVHKLSRAVNGNPDIKDTWDDIAGYAKLVADRIVV